MAADGSIAGPSSAPNPAAPTNQSSDLEESLGSPSVTVPSTQSPSWSSRAAQSPSNNRPDYGMRRRSVAERLNTLAQAGGPNSLTNFASSWQRAAAFRDIVTGGRSYTASEDAPINRNGFERADVESGHSTGRSLLRAALQNDGERRILEHPFSEDQDGPALEHSYAPESDSVQARIKRKRSMHRESLSYHDFASRFSSPFSGRLGTSYGTTNTQTTEAVLPHSPPRIQVQPPASLSSPDKENDPLLGAPLIPEAEEDFHNILGQSTLPQTVFNSVNVLVGVGLLSLPLAIAYSGWIIGLTFFLLSALTTSYTAKLLAKCLDLDTSLTTFADIAYISFGPRARFIVSILFSIELVGACVALVVLFADSAYDLFPGGTITEFKILCGIILLPLSFVPLRLLSFTSIVGILSCVAIILAIVLDGLIKPHAPGSLREPMKTTLFPLNWRTLPLSFGLLMAPWGGHSVFPNIYRDMRHPQKYSKAVNATYVFTFSSELAIAIIGYLMFGVTVRDEVTSNIFITNGYPKWVNNFIIASIAIIPFTKVPLNSRPIITTLEVLFGLDDHAFGPASGLVGISGFSRGLLKIIIRVATIVTITIVAIAVPSFDRVMSLLGSLACFTICVILPVSFHLKIFGKDLSQKEKLLNWTLVVVCSFLAIVGTGCSFLPKTWLDG